MSFERLGIGVAAFVALPAALITAANVTEMQTQNKYLKTIAKIIQCVPSCFLILTHLSDALKGLFIYCLGGKPYPWGASEAEIRTWQEVTYPIFDVAEKWAERIAIASAVILALLPGIIAALKSLAHRGDCNKIESFLTIADKTLSIFIKIMNCFLSFIGMALVIAAGNPILIVIYSLVSSINLICLARFCVKMVQTPLTQEIANG